MFKDLTLFLWANVEFYNVMHKGEKNVLRMQNLLNVVHTFSVCGLHVVQWFILTDYMNDCFVKMFVNVTYADIDVDIYIL